MDRSGGCPQDTFVAEYYDYVVPYRDRQDIAFFVDIARRSEGPVLELGCGTGRVTIPTARAGIEITGLDSSPSMLSVCRNKLAREPEAVRSKVLLVQGDMRQFDLGRTFRLVTIPFRPFQHLITVEDQLSCLNSIYRHLVDRGKLVLGDGREERLVERFQMRYVFRFEAEHLLARSGFEMEEVYADYDKSPYGSKYPGELICVARRA